MLLIFYILIAFYLIFRGARETGFGIPSSNVIEGVLLFLSGLFLLLANVL